MTTQAGHSTRLAAVSIGGDEPNALRKIHPILRRVGLNPRWHVVTRGAAGSLRIPTKADIAVIIGDLCGPRTGDAIRQTKRLGIPFVSAGNTHELEAALERYGFCNTFVDTTEAEQDSFFGKLTAALHVEQTKPQNEQPLTHKAENPEQQPETTSLRELSQLLDKPVMTLYERALALNLIDEAMPGELRGEIRIQDEFINELDHTNQPTTPKPVLNTPMAPQPTPPSQVAPVEPKPQQPTAQSRPYKKRSTVRKYDLTREEDDLLRSICTQPGVNGRALLAKDLVVVASKIGISLSVIALGQTLKFASRFGGTKSVQVQMLGKQQNAITWKLTARDGAPPRINTPATSVSVQSQLKPKSRVIDNQTNNTATRKVQLLTQLKDIVRELIREAEFDVKSIHVDQDNGIQITPRNQKIKMGLD